MLRCRRAVFTLRQKLERVDEEVVLLEREIADVQRHHDARIRSYDVRFAEVNEMMAEWDGWEESAHKAFVRPNDALSAASAASPAAMHPHTERSCSLMRLHRLSPRHVVVAVQRRMTFGAFRVGGRKSGGRSSCKSSTRKRPCA
jgi:hypothetical protein